MPPQDTVGVEARDKNLVAPYRIKLNEIVAKTEAQAFYDGYYLAVGFGNGSCKSMFCPDTDCQALVPGKSCAHRLRARSTMEGVGIDCFSMATSVGWDIYPIGQETLPEEVPYGLRLGLVLIA